MIIRKFTYTSTDITSQVSDKINNFLWIAYNESGGVCNLKKVSAFSPNQVYFNLNRTVNKINKLFIDSTNLYTAYDSPTLFGEIITSINPLTSTTEISIPGGVIEKPVDVTAQGSNLFFLTPGITTGENAKIIKYSTSGVYDQTIDLIKTGDIVYNALSFVIDTSGDIWIATNDSPSNLVRVYDTGGNIWDFTVTSII